MCVQSYVYRVYSEEERAALARSAPPLSDEEKARRLEGIALFLDRGIRVVVPLNRARAVWYNATLTDIPAFLHGKHFLVEHFVTEMESLRTAQSFDHDVWVVVAALEAEFRAYYPDYQPISRGTDEQEQDTSGAN